VLLAALACAACKSAGTPEEELHSLVAEAEEFAEARDAGALRDLIANDYRDATGRDAGEVRGFLHAWLIAHPSVNLLTRIDSIKLEGTELARVRVTIGMIGREAKGDSGWDLAAGSARQPSSGSTAFQRSRNAAMASSRMAEWRRDSSSCDGAQTRQRITPRSAAASKRLGYQRSHSGRIAST
jgi:hypothetical protein